MLLFDFNKISLNRKIQVGLGFSLIILIISSLVSFNSIQRLIEQSKLVDHTNQVILNLENIISKMKDAETGQRGYLLTDNEDFLDLYYGSYEKVLDIYNETKDLTYDNPLQQKYIDSIKPIIDKRYEWLQAGIDVYKKDKGSTYQKINDGRQLMFQCRSLINKMQNEELRLLQIRSEEANKYASTSPIVIIISSLLAISVSIFSLFFISRDINNKARIQQELDKNNYLLAGSAKLSDLLMGEKNLQKAGDKILVHLCELMKAQAGVLYMLEDDGMFHLTNRYAVENNEAIPSAFSLGEGLLGQSALERKTLLLDTIPSKSVVIKSGLTLIQPVSILIVPFYYNDNTVALIELINKDKFLELDLEFIEITVNTISVFINGLKSEIKTTELLAETQSQSEELASQQEELRQINEELEEQTESLKQQQEELKIANEELEHQSRSVELKNKELEVASFEIQRKSKDLEISSKYKSEFLANMSHELRTPLNSLLILSKDLADNNKKNLDSSQIESAQIIYNSGQDLLQLINEVLDLSKIEAGKMELNIDKLNLEELRTSINRSFKHIISKKGLDFFISIEKDASQFIFTDRQRLEQIIRNLIANSVKFTHTGSISVDFRKKSATTLAIDISDTGIGIPEEKQAIIFEAFQQADGGTSRKYGGTGLGLSISKELVKLLGGTISLKSSVNEGSIFSITIPFSISSDSSLQISDVILPAETSSVQEEKKAAASVSDDRDNLSKKDKAVLIIEDDIKFARILSDHAHLKQFKVLKATTGEEGLLLAHKYQPSAIILDLILPDMNGKTVLSELKNTPSLRHIPVHVISASERTIDTIKGGAVEFLMKPVNREQLEDAFLRIENFIDRKMKNLLIIEDDENSRKSIRMLIGNGDVKCLEAPTGKDALKMLKENTIDCIILDLGLPDMTGFELIKKLQNGKSFKVPPIIVYTGKDLTKAENNELQEFAETIIIKGVKSEERLLDEASLFLHRTINNLPDSKRQIIFDLYNKETVFLNKKILVVDDDMRNVFALSKVLKEAGMEVIKAENGIKALEALDVHKNIDMVLMDIMMPEMDGYEAMKRIRIQDKFKNLPILALTAKAMKEDRKKCIDAGANDYISKPIELARLLSLMRVWINK